MRKSLLMSAAALGLAFGAPAFAQTGTTPMPPATGAHNGLGYSAGYNAPSTRGPYSAQASNIDRQDMRSEIAPILPTPAGAQSASPEQLLGMAQSALRRGQTGEAQQALEMAETRLLNRVTPPSMANSPDQNPTIQQINQALQALGRHDRSGAEQAIQEAMAGSRGMTRAGMNQSGMTNNGAYGTSRYGTSGYGTSGYDTNASMGGAMPNTGSPMTPQNPQMPTQTPANGTPGAGAPGAGMPR